MEGSREIIYRNQNPLPVLQVLHAHCYHHAVGAQLLSARLIYVPFQGLPATLFPFQSYPASAVIQQSQRKFIAEQKSITCVSLGMLGFSSSCPFSAVSFAHQPSPAPTFWGNVINESILCTDIVFSNQFRANFQDVIGVADGQFCTIYSYYLEGREGKSLGFGFVFQLKLIQTQGNGMELTKRQRQRRKWQAAHRAFSRLCLSTACSLILAGRGDLLSQLQQKKPKQVSGQIIEGRGESNMGVPVFTTHTG